MNVFITGSNGFIGRAVVDVLKHNHHLIGCGTKSQAQSDVDCYVQWDIGHENTPDELSEMNIDAIIHIASNKSTDDSDLELSYANLVGSHKIINLCKERGCKKAILFSSLPIIHRPMGRPIREDEPYDPPSVYHATKVAQELMFNLLSNQGVQTIILRIPSPIAPKMNERTIFTIFGDAALNNAPIYVNGKGTRRQNYIDIRDIAQACDKLLASSTAEGIYNIGSEKTVSNMELAEKWIQIADSKSVVRFSGKSDLSDDQDWTMDLSRLKKDICYKQEYTIERTMAEYIMERRRIVSEH